MEWHWNDRMMVEWEVSQNPVFSSPKKTLHSSSFRHSFIISKCLEWKEMKITMERYHFSDILLNSTSFRHSRMMMEWPNEGKWSDIFEPRQNPWFWNSPHSPVIPSFYFWRTPSFQNDSGMKGMTSEWFNMLLSL